MADPVTITCPSSCTVQLELTTPLLNLSPVEGAEIAGAILAVWAIAWGIRALIQTLRSSDGFTNESD